ncbi:hypothetical protein F5146DRAFT_1029653 [Armillaria mellea]|nr:hypothetical protein F5146DRAFT_1029653 [Armillaria mellea]
MAGTCVVRCVLLILCVYSVCRSGFVSVCLYWIHGIHRPNRTTGPLKLGATQGPVPACADCPLLTRTMLMSAY